MDICIDSRKIKPGQTFIPVKGKNFDGHHFIKDAIKKGAQILDVDLHQYAKKYRKKLKATVIGVTGSAGKTTVKDLLYSVLSKKYNVVKTIENQNNEIGAPLTILKADAETDFIIVEMGMRKKGDLSFLSKIIRPNCVVITNIGKTHIELLKTERNIACAKSEIFQKPVNWESKEKACFINYETQFYKLLSEKASRAGYRIYPFNGQEKCDQNINLCYAAGKHFGLSDDEIFEGLRTYEGSAHRLSKKTIKGITIIDDTYNANPDGVIYALQYLKRLEGRKIFVFGDMLELGRFSKIEHKKIISEAINAGVSILFTYGKETSILKSSEIPIFHFENLNELNETLLKELKTRDVVLMKGSRGLKMEVSVQYIEENL
jgi:UDP-N-acetylmuramoyl-tripeptide--D-alanyl-D-alanine ligase